MKLRTAQSPVTNKKGGQKIGGKSSSRYLKTTGLRFTR